jgi:hypothetical protein
VGYHHPQSNWHVDLITLRPASLGQKQATGIPKPNLHSFINSDRPEGRDDEMIGWPRLLLLHSAEDRASATISFLGAHAARMSNSQVGLSAAIRCVII